MSSSSSAAAPPPTTQKDLHYDMALASTLYQWEKVADLFQWARDCPSLTLDATVFELGVKALAHLGQWELAHATLEEMWLANHTPSDTTYAHVVDVLQLAGRWSTVLELLEHMRARGETPGALTYKAALLGCARAGEWAALLRVYEDMSAAAAAAAADALFGRSALDGDAQMLNIALVAALRLGDWERGLRVAESAGGAVAGDGDTLALLQKLRAMKAEAEAKAAEDERR
jgi:pentatricopeptide repeat protein